MERLDYELEKDYMGFMSYKLLEEKHGIKYKDVLEWATREGYRQQRAEELVGKLEDLDDTFPSLIKEAIWKLQIIRFVADRYSSGNIHDLNTVEKISNYAIKARLEDYSTWGVVDYVDGFEVTIISNDHKLNIEWVAAVADSGLNGLEQYAKTLRDKVTLQDNIKEVVVFSREHAETCKEHGLDPRDYTQKELKEYVDSLEWISGLGQEK